jgi:hypothetical protein
MLIELDRDSVCMGDDCMPHKRKTTYSDNSRVSSLLSNLCDYVPRMNNVVWAIVSLEAESKVIGYLISDNSGKYQIDMNMERQLSSLFLKSRDTINVSCNYYHNSSFTWINGTDGGIINKYPECATLIKKVKMHYGG